MLSLDNYHTQLNCIKANAYSNEHKEWKDNKTKVNAKNDGKYIEESLEDKAGATLKQTGAQNRAYSKHGAASNLVCVVVHDQFLLYDKRQDRRENKTAK